jgi:hypothetical protein
VLLKGVGSRYPYDHQINPQIKAWKGVGKDTEIGIYTSQHKNIREYLKKNVYKFEYISLGNIASPIVYENNIKYSNWICQRPFVLNTRVCYITECGKSQK